MKLYLRAAMAALALSTLCFAQAPATKAQPKKKVTTTATVRKSAPATKADLEKLQEVLNAQGAQLEALRQQNATLSSQLQQTQTQLNDAQTAAHDAQTKVAALEAEQRPVVTKLQGDVTDMKNALVNTVNTMQEDQKRVTDLEHPTTLHFKGISITPGGFLATDVMYRSHAENTDVISSFNGVPFNADPRSKLSEFRGSARQSRISLLAEGQAGKVKLTGYYELDFLGAAPTANENQSTSYNPRIRQLWGQAGLPGGWTLTAGQTWSLITMNKSGIATRGEWVPATIDGQYVVGYDFARLMTVRIVKTTAGKQFSFGVALENPATLVSIKSGDTGLVAGLSSPGTGTLGNTTVSSCTSLPCSASPMYSTNLAPDVIIKAAFDPKHFRGHYEIKAVGRFFRERILTPGNVGLGQIPGNYTTPGGGFGAGMIIPIVPKKVDFIAEGSYGWGLARYGDSSNVDVVVRDVTGVRTDLHLAPVENFHVMGGLEIHPNPKLDWYIYGGDEYLGRTYQYGLTTNDYHNCWPASETAFSCSANMKNIYQATTGFWYRFFKGPYGTLQYGAQASCTQKVAWSGERVVSPVTFGTAKGGDTIIMTSFRYYLP